MNVMMPWTASAETPVDGVAARLDEFRRAISQEAERLAQAAAQYSREAGAHAARLADEAGHQAGKVAHDAGSQASVVAHDPVGSASTIAQQLVRGAAELGTAIAISGRKAARDLGRDAQSAAEDLRHLRITTEPRQSKPDFMPGIALLAGFGGGLALMYFLDPEKGKQRRTMLGERLMSFIRRTTQAATGRARDLRNRAVGTMHETRAAAAGSSAPAGELDADADTQTWETGYSNGSEPLAGTAEPSTTDTWGQQPLPHSSRVAIG